MGRRLADSSRLILKLAHERPRPLDQLVVATGIPREDLAERLKVLVRKGWLVAVRQRRSNVTKRPQTVYGLARRVPIAASRKRALKPSPHPTWMSPRLPAAPPPKEAVRTVRLESQGELVMEAV